ncbi:MAG: hypothetical protein Q8L87_18090 [Anaerolineales bacterium]|jgi:hypothetical protein|nr:hypothetical protein [Anaerolineales bacterium]
MQLNKKVSVEGLLLAYGIPFIILIGVSIVLFVKATTMVSSGNDTRAVFYALVDGMDNYYGFKTAWRPRLFSTGLAALTVNFSNVLFDKNFILSAQSPLEMAVGIWTVGWFALTSLALIIAFKQRSLFYIFGLFTVISFGYMDIARTNLALRLYPWDLPSLFFFTLFVLFFIHKKYAWLLFLIPFGVGFKETIMVLSFGFLLIERPLKQRIYLFLAVLGLSFGVKLLLDIYVHAPLFFTMETEAEQRFLTYNLSRFRDATPFFINAGTLLAFIILPDLGNKNIIAFKLIAIFFVCGNLLFGILTEYRIWLEVAPFALYAFDVRIYGSLVNQST